MSVNDFSSWAAIHASLPGHRKTYALSRLLGIKRTLVVGMIVRLWLWALEDGSGYLDTDSYMVADLMEWDGDRDILIRALIAARWLDESKDGTTWHIHNWEDYTANYIERLEKRRQQNRIAQKVRREKLKILQITTPAVSMTSANVSGDEVLMKPHNRTEQNPNIIYKEIYKERAASTDTLRDTFFSFNANGRYKGLDFENEFAKFSEYWLEGKRKLKNPKLACHNWLDRCLQRKTGGQNGTNQRYSTQGGTKLPNRETGYTPAPLDPGLDALVAAQRDGAST